MLRKIAMIDIDDIKQAEPVLVESVDIELTTEEEFTRKEKELHLRRSEHELKESQQNTELRKIYINRNFLLTCVWLVIVLLVVLCQGFGLGHFNLHDSVLITLLSTTTANIIGVLVIVITYLFKNNHK